MGGLRYGLIPGSKLLALAGALLFHFFEIIEWRTRLFNLFHRRLRLRLDHRFRCEVLRLWNGRLIFSRLGDNRGCRLPLRLVSRGSILRKRSMFHGSLLRVLLRYLRLECRRLFWRISRRR
jgi:hypothetical protein